MIDPNGTMMTERVTVLGYFSLQCLQGILACDTETGTRDGGMLPTDHRARQAVKHAKALIKALNEDEDARRKACHSRPETSDGATGSDGL